MPANHLTLVLQRVHIARRTRLGGNGGYALPYKPHLRMRVADGRLRPDWHPYPVVRVEWIRPLPDGRARADEICTFADFIPREGWALIRDVLDPNTRNAVRSIHPRFYQWPMK